MFDTRTGAAVRAFESQDNNLSRLTAELSKDFKSTVEEEITEGRELIDKVTQAVKAYYSDKVIKGEEALTIRNFFQDLAIVPKCASDDVYFKEGTTFKSDPFPVSIGHQLNLMFRRLQVRSFIGGMVRRHPLEDALSSLQRTVEMARDKYLDAYRHLVLRGPRILALMEGHESGARIGSAMTARYMDQHFGSTIGKGVSLMESPEPRPASGGVIAMTTGRGSPKSTTVISPAPQVTDRVFSDTAFKYCREAIATGVIEIGMIEALRIIIAAPIVDFFRSESMKPRVQQVLLDNFSNVEASNSCLSHKCEFKREVRFSSTTHHLPVLIRRLSDMIEALESAARGCSGLPNGYQQLLSRLEKCRDDAAQKLVELTQAFRVAQIKFHLLHQAIDAYEAGRTAGTRSGRSEVQQAGGAVVDVTAAAMHTLGAARNNVAAHATVTAAHASSTRNLNTPLYLLNTGDDSDVRGNNDRLREPLLPAGEPQ
ncbi:MAG: hypothetical protein K0Q57_762 [Gammaproteobacteria bacterium]|jgi:hypothetical protein|nr:hypothetical protein [Gammaproteobacteria bacterium]